MSATRTRRTAPTAPAVRAKYPSMPVPGMFIVLTTDYVWSEDRPELPPHPLAIPPDWAKVWDSEWKLESRDFVDREEALQRMARMNESCEDDWWLAFEIGEAAPSSVLILNKGAAAEFLIDCSLTVIHPTEEEIRRICYAPKKKTA